MGSRTTPVLDDGVLHNYCLQWNSVWASNWNWEAVPRTFYTLFTSNLGCSPSALHCDQWVVFVIATRNCNLAE